MNENFYHYTECGLRNISLMNGYEIFETNQGTTVSINDIDGLHKAIGLRLVFSKKDLSGEEIRFLRHELLMSQNGLASLLGVSEQTVRRWENDKICIPKSSEFLLRLLYREKTTNLHGKIATLLKDITNLEDQINEKEMLFEDTMKGWKVSA